MTSLLVGPPNNRDTQAAQNGNGGTDYTRKGGLTTRPGGFWSYFSMAPYNGELTPFRFRLGSTPPVTEQPQEIQGRR